MFLAKKLSKLSLMFLAGCIFGLVVLHFMSSLVVLTRTTDRMLSKAMSVGFPSSNVTLRSNREAKLQLALPTHRDGTFKEVNYDPDAHNVDSRTGHRAIENVSADARTQEDRKTKKTETDMTTSEREQFQQAQVEGFCKRNGLNIKRHSYLGRHILVNSISNTAFCFAPKVGCTNLKILFFIAQGALPRNELSKSRDGVDQQKLEAAISKLSLALLTQSNKNLIIKSYYKFVMYRNPIERLFSAYRSKVQRFPLQGLGYDKPHYNWLRMKIFQYKHQMFYNQWHTAGGNRPIRINFSDFIDYWLYRGGLTFDEHFQSIYNLCQPCQVRYNYYGNFKTFTDDSKVLVNRLGSNSSLLREGYYQEGESTTDLAPQYYKLLSGQQKKLIINKLALDLSFYYSIFPSERDSHKIVMSTDVDIPTFTY